MRVVPIVVFSMVSGVVADAWDRRKLMLVTQIAAAAVALALAALTFRGIDARLADLRAGGARRGGRRVRPAGAPVARADAGARASTCRTRSASTRSCSRRRRSLGPSLGGLLIAATGVGWAYVANAVSFAFVIVALLMMRDVPERGPREAPGAATTTCRWRAALEGLRFVFRSPLIRSTMLLDFFATFFSSATALLPIFAQDILHVGAHGLRLAVRGAGGRVR